jgi:hypothetical protein
MRCIFCKQDSSASRSAEHVLPESLGNTTAVLAPGVVCDKCNNYFSRKVEKPFLEAPAISELRFQQAIPSKRGRVPPSSGLLLPQFPVSLYRHLKGPFVGSILVDNPDGIRHLLSSDNATIVFSGNGRPPDVHVVSRFLAKAAVEALALRLMSVPGGLDFVVDESQFDPIRRHAREGHPRTWPHSVRRIYSADRMVTDDAGEAVQTLYEYDFLYTPASELYFVLAMFGLELAINVGGPEVDGYVQWLKDHSGISPLYT